MIFGVDSNPGVIFWVDSSPGVMFGVDSNFDVTLGVIVCGIVLAEAETAIMLSRANIILYIDIPPIVNS
ncbi:hypothetical protein W01_08080 [Candidatus Nitrotoga sp. AM1P]|nr:hypothetical protein W01_08080 [Candidatus Nitrotoga sp. AM1P]